jgi:hypothetical protein
MTKQSTRKMRWMMSGADCTLSQAGTVACKNMDALVKNLQWMAVFDWGLDLEKDKVEFTFEDVGEYEEDTVSVRFLTGPYPSYIDPSKPTTPPWANEAPKKVAFWKQEKNEHLEAAAYHVIGSQGDNLDLETCNV